MEGIENTHVCTVEDKTTFIRMIINSHLLHLSRLYMIASDPLSI